MCVCVCVCNCDCNCKFKWLLPLAAYCCRSVSLLCCFSRCCHCYCCSHCFCYCCRSASAAAYSSRIKQLPLAAAAGKTPAHAHRAYKQIGTTSVLSARARRRTVYLPYLLLLLLGYRALGHRAVRRLARYSSTVRSRSLQRVATAALLCCTGR